LSDRSVDRRGVRTPIGAVVIDVAQLGRVTSARRFTRDHGTVTPDAIEQDADGARHVLAAVEEHGIGPWAISCQNWSRTAADWYRIAVRFV
jgi:hypothetical protein